MVSLSLRAIWSGRRFASRAFVPALLAIAFCLILHAAAYADLPAPPLKRLAGPEKAKVLAALAGLIILGFSAVLLTWLGARITHRYRHGTFFFRPTPRPGEHDWTRKPLIPNDDPLNPEP